MFVAHRKCGAPGATSEVMRPDEGWGTRRGEDRQWDTTHGPVQYSPGGNTMSGMRALSLVQI